MNASTAEARIIGTDEGGYQIIDLTNGILEQEKAKEQFTPREVELVGLEGEREWLRRDLREVELDARRGLITDDTGSSTAKLLRRAVVI